MAEGCIHSGSQVKPERRPSSVDPRRVEPQSTPRRCLPQLSLSLSVIAFVCHSSFAGGVAPLPSEDARSPSGEALRLTLTDQYGGQVTYPLSDASTPSVVLVAASDRRGAEANRGWAAALAARYAPHLEGRRMPRLVILPVAHLGGVPKLLRSFVRAFFRGRNSEGEPLLPIALDWRGDLRRQHGLVAGVPNISVLDERGRMVVRRAGLVEDVGTAVFRELDRLLGRPAVGALE